MLPAVDGSPAGSAAGRGGDERSQEDPGVGDANLFVPPTSRRSSSLHLQDRGPGAGRGQTGGAGRVVEAIKALQLPKLVTRTPPASAPGTRRGRRRVLAQVEARSAVRGSPRKAGYVVGPVVEVWFEGDRAGARAGVNKIMTIAQRSPARPTSCPTSPTADLETVRQRRSRRRRSRHPARRGHGEGGGCPHHGLQLHRAVRGDCSSDGLRTAMVVKRGRRDLAGAYGGRALGGSVAWAGAGIRRSSRSTTRRCRPRCR